MSLQNKNKNLGTYLFIYLFVLLASKIGNQDWVTSCKTHLVLLKQKTTRKDSKRLASGMCLLCKSGFKRLFLTTGGEIETVHWTRKLILCLLGVFFRPSPEEAQLWSEAFDELLANKCKLPSKVRSWQTRAPFILCKVSLGKKLLHRTGTSHFLLRQNSGWPLLLAFLPLTHCIWGSLQPRFIESIWLFLLKPFGLWNCGFCTLVNVYF